MQRSRTLAQRHSVYLPRSESPRDEPSSPNNHNSNSIEVCVRMRPLLDSFEDEVCWEIDEQHKTIKSKIDNVDLRSLNLSHPKHYNDISIGQKFTFDNVEGPGSKTKDLYNKLFKKIVDSVVQGYNGTIFMYGQTTSGKTYTMLGTQKDPGVLPHSLRTIFLEMAKMKDYTFQVSVSYLEIYNEVINDLLVPGSTNLKIGDDPHHGVVVKGLKRQEVMTFEDAIYLMSFGEEHRKYRETNVNEQSSRSHTIYQVFIESFENTEDQVKKRRISCLNLVDLAGSERLADNGGSDGLQIGETGHINKSLFCLTNVIKKLADGRTSHIPYRDSKLTRILSNAVGGNSLTAVVCAISPALVNYAQTLSTLRFASRAKRVKNDPTENLVIDVADQKLKEEVKYLREQLSRSENQITKVNGINLKLEDNLLVTKQEIKALQKEMADLKNLVIKESPRNHGEDNISNTSLFDIMGESVPLIKSKSGKKTSVPFNMANPLTHSGEIFFGDQILSVYEHIIAESTAVNTAASIENGFTEGGNIAEWSAECLKAKQAYLKDLQELQRTYAKTLDKISHKYTNKSGNFQGQSQLVELESQVKTYLETEFHKIDSVQLKINDAIKAMSPKSQSRKEPVVQRSTSTTSIRKIDESFAKEQPIQNWELMASSENGTSQKSESGSHMKQYYDEVLSKMEKKYDEIYSLVTQSLMKSKDNIVTDNSVMLEKKGSYINVQNMLQQTEPNRHTEEDQQRNYTDNTIEQISYPRRLSTVSRSRSLNTGLRARGDSPFLKNRQDTEIIGRSYSSITDYGHGAVYLWGSGKDGRLGNGRYANESVPVPIRDLRFAKVVCGYHNTFGVSQDGMLYGWGRNENGQLGVGSTMNAPIPINITPLNKITIVDIACGWQHCLALSAYGRLYSWGCGDEGQLGHGDNYELLAPAEIKFFEKTQVERIACGHSQSAAITTEGALYTWGHNSDHRLMIANARNYFIPTLTELQKVRSQTLNQEETDIVSLSMGATHMCVVTKSGKVYAAGRGNEGQLGKKLINGLKNTIIYQPEIEILNEEENEVLASNFFTEIEAFGSENKATMVACGEKFTLVLNERNMVYSFGDASDGCLGIQCDENEKNICEPKLVEKLVDKKIIAIAAGARHAACISESGELYCWGFNYYDQLEVGEKVKTYYIPKKIEKLSKQNIGAVSCGYFHTAALAL